MPFWLTFFLYVGSLVISELLRPKPNIENAKPSGLGDFQFPTSQEGRTVPLVWGTVRINGPNLLWFGDLKTEAIKEKVKTGLFSSDRITVGYKYFVGIQFGLCRGPADPDGVGGGLGRIWLDDELLYDPSSPLTFSDSGTVTFNSPEFFGEDSGGITGTLRIFDGAADQSQSTYLAGVSDIDSTLLPNYRGTSYALLEQVYIGNAPNIRPWAFEWQRIPDGLDMATNDPGAEIVNGRDANPMNVLYEVLNNSEWGLNVANITVSAFRAAASVLAAEGNGYSRILDRPIKVEDLIREIEEQVDGFLYLDAATDEYTFRLIRESDYPSPLDDLPLFDESNVKSLEFSRNSWSDTVNIVRVGYSDPDKDYVTTYAQAQDNANRIIQGGQDVVVTRQYPGVTNGDLAAKLAQRELRTLSYPLGSAKMITDRARYDVIPGDLVRIDWPPFNLEDFYGRVTRVRTGTLENNEMAYEVTQDIFEAPVQVNDAPGDSLWIPPSTDPVDVTDYRMFALPPQYQDDSTLQQFGLVAVRANGLQTRADVHIKVQSGSPPQAPASDGEYVFEVSLSPFTPTGLLVGDLSCNQESPGGGQDFDDDVVFLDATTDIELVDQTASIADLDLASPPNLALIDDEIIFFESISDEGSGVYKLTGVRRGMLDTVPADHIDNTRVWFFTYGMAVVEPVLTSLNERLYFKILSVSTGGEQSLSDVSADFIEDSNRYEGAAPPVNPTINGVPFCDLVEVSGSSFTIDWYTRPNELTTSRQLTQEQGAGQVTPGDVQYEIRMYTAGPSPRDLIYSATVSLESPSDGAMSHNISDYRPSPLLSPETYQLEMWAVENGYESQKWVSTVFNRVPGLSPQSPLPPPSPESPQGPSPESPQGPSPESPQGPSPESPQGPSPESPQGPSPLSPQGPSPESPQGSEDPYYYNVSLLLPFDGADGSTSPVADASYHAHDLTFNGTAQIDTAQSKFGGASLLLDGNSDSVSVASQNELLLRSEDFTIEAWIRYNGSAGGNQVIVGKWPGASNREWILRGGTTSGLMFLYSTTGANVVTVSVSKTWNTDQWYHVAVCREGDFLYFFIDGSLEDTVAFGVDLFVGSADVEIGSNDGGTANFFDGWIEDLRITQGVARYTSAFSVPTSPHPTSGDWVDPHYNNVSLLAPFSGTDGATTATDFGPSSHPLTFEDNAQIDTAQTKFGGGSLLLDNVDDIVSVDVSPRPSDFHLQEEDWTIEAWVRFNGDPTNGAGTIVSLYETTGNNRSWRLEWLQTNNIRIVYSTSGSGTTTETESWTPSGDTWYHVAVVREGNNLRFFIDGVRLAADRSHTGSYFDADTKLRIGSHTSTSYWDGWIEDLRITKGYARYVDDFTAPPRLLPTSGP